MTRGKFIALSAAALLPLPSRARPDNLNELAKAWLLENGFTIEELPVSLRLRVSSVHGKAPGELSFQGINAYVYFRPNTFQAAWSIRVGEGKEIPYINLVKSIERKDFEVDITEFTPEEVSGVRMVINSTWDDLVVALPTPIPTPKKVLKLERPSFLPA